MRTFPKYFGPLGVLTLLAPGACLRGEPRGVPLYSGPEPRGGRAAIALLFGPVKAVDGVAVDSAQNGFELLPGCHLVEIGGTAGEMDMQHGGWAMTVPRMFYAFRMRAGATYEIEAKPEPSIGLAPTGTARIVARERDAQGQEQLVPYVVDAADIEACRRWIPTAG